MTTEEKDIEMMKDINNWTEITKGIYRFAISSDFCYEIHLLYWFYDTDILTAKASAYAVGDWKTNRRVYERECLLSRQPLFSCVGAAIRDYKGQLY